MTDDDWNEIVASLRQERDVERMVAAAKRLQDVATLEDVPRLRGLLEERSFVVREAAAFPLAYILGPRCLRDLLVAECRGTREGLDNDTLDAAIGEVLALHEQEARVTLDALSRESDGELRVAAQGWLERVEPTS